MADDLEELPLFPLNTVLFPFATLQLHVFEDRYRELIERCEREDRAFGIVLIRSGDEVGSGADPYLIGTAVRIRAIHRYDDGNMDVTVQGERRFRIRQLDDSRPYLSGLVEAVYEAPIQDSDRTLELMTQARAEFEQLVQRLFERQEFSVQVVFPSDPVVLSFTIANLLSINNLQKQRLLEVTDTIERIEELMPILRAHISDATQPTYYRLAANDLKDWISPN